MEPTPSETIIPLEDCCSLRFSMRRTYRADTWVRQPTKTSLKASICCPSLRLTAAKVTWRIFTVLDSSLDRLAGLLNLKREQNPIDAVRIRIYRDDWHVADVLGRVGDKTILPHHHNRNASAKIKRRQILPLNEL